MRRLTGRVVTVAAVLLNAALAEGVPPPTHVLCWTQEGEQVGYISGDIPLLRSSASLGEDLRRSQEAAAAAFRDHIRSEFGVESQVNCLSTRAAEPRANLSRLISAGGTLTAYSPW